VWRLFSNHYADWLTREPDVDVFVHEFGRNLRHPGTLAGEYDNVRDAVGDSGASVRLSSWLGITSYRLSGICRFLICIISGLGGFLGFGAGSWLVGPRSGVNIPASDGVYTVEYKCGGVYEQFLDWCGVVVHRVSSSASGRCVFFHVLNVTGVIISPFHFLDVGQSASVAGRIIEYL
jgi:hypothetical protein